MVSAAGAFQKRPNRPPGLMAPAFAAGASLLGQMKGHPIGQRPPPWRGQTEPLGRAGLRIWVRIEEPSGPGLDVALNPRLRGPVITGARRDGAWLGADRGVIAETDIGDGTPLPTVIALPSSGSRQAWLEAEVRGAFIEDERIVVVTTLPGHAPPIEALLRVIGRIAPDARSIATDDTEQHIRAARERYRRRRAEGRRTDRPAWLPADQLVSGSALHSSAEQRLGQLPPRFVRGLHGLLDDDERILASVERPPDASHGLFDRRHSRDRRAGLLVLTDRQLLWMVDHLPPDRYLFDWGVDAQLLPLEVLSGARLEIDRTARLAVATAGGEVAFPMPPDSAPELRAMLEHIERFLPSPALRRRYEIDATEHDWTPWAPFGQTDEARDRIAALRASRPDASVAFFAPRRPGVKQSVAMLLAPGEVAIETDGKSRRLSLRGLRAISLTLSPLIGRVELSADAAERFSYPASLSTPATAFIRQLRRAWANA